MEEICNLQNNQEKKEDQKKKKPKQPINKEALKYLFYSFCYFGEMI